jgi:hypothetical protein
MSVVVRPGSPAAGVYASGREAAAREPGFPARQELNLRFFGGRTVESLTFTNVYLGGAAAWSQDDIARIDASIAAAMEDPDLNNVIAQYWADESPTTSFVPSRVLEQPVPSRVSRADVERFVAAIDQRNGLSAFDLTSTVFCLLLPSGVVLVDQGTVDSKHGLGGYHGSVHPARGDATETVYYAVSVYSVGDNGIVGFDEPWKNVCATLYHELCEARTDPDVEDAIRAANSPDAERFLGWYSMQGGEIGDIPMEEAGPDLGAVMQEVPLANGTGTVPIQLMWSNAVDGPEGPIATKHPPAAG